MITICCEFELVTIKHAKYQQFVSAIYSLCWHFSQNRKSGTNQVIAPNPSIVGQFSVNRC